MRIALCLILFLTVTIAEAGWPEFRGPDRDGVAAGDLPHTWSEEENVTWKKEIHGLGWSTPIILEGKIWLTTATEDGRQMSILCLDEQSGEVLLDRVFITNDNPEPLANPMNTYASPSGVIEEGRVYLHFGSYGTFCLDTETFETVWRRDRSTRFDDETDGIPANSGDMRKSYSTPIFVTVGERVQMICNGAKAAWSYDAKTGEELWSVHYSTHSPSSRPIHSEELGLVYLNTGLGKAEIWATQLDPEARGEIEETHVEWKLLQRTPKRSSPVLANDLLFMANAGVISCVDAKSGEVYWAERAGADYSASLLASGDHVYFFDEEGLCTVVEATKEFRKVAENTLDAGMMASPAASGDALFVRTKTHLYRIEK